MRIRTPVPDEKTIEGWRQKTRRAYVLSANFLHSILGKTSKEEGSCCWMLPGATLILVFRDRTSSSIVTVAVDPCTYDSSLKPEFLIFLKQVLRIDYALVTHLHRDHYDPEVLAFLAKFFDTKISVPRGLMDRIRGETSIRNNLLPLEPNRCVDLTSSLAVLPFESPHGETLNYGYALHDRERRIVITSDIRDYSTASVPESGKGADVMVFNMWFGSFRANNPDAGLVRDAADYILRARPERIVFNHLYDTGRDPRDIWQDAHCRLIAEMLGWEPERFCIPDYENVISLWRDG